MDLKRGQLPPSLLPPLNEQMEASATIITTLPGSLLTNRNNTGGANKPQSNMTPPLMLLTSLSLQGRTSRTDSFLSNGPATAAISTSGGGRVSGGDFFSEASASARGAIVESLARRIHQRSPRGSYSCSTQTVRRFCRFCKFRYEMTLLSILPPKLHTRFPLSSFVSVLALGFLPRGVWHSLSVSHTFSFFPQVQKKPNCNNSGL